jgi:hypothetical protein
MVEIDPEQAAEVRRAFELVRDGKSIRATAEIMSVETGRVWRPTTVARIVSREVYKLREPGRIIDPRLWNATRDALVARRRRSV